MKRITLLVAASLFLGLASYTPTANAGGCGWFGGFGYRGINTFGYRGYSRGLFINSHRHFGYSSFYRPRVSYYSGFYSGCGAPFVSYRSYYRPTYWYTPTYYSYPAYRGCHLGYFGSNTLAYPPAASYARADINYGPDAVKEFMGVDRDFAKGPLATKPVVVLADTGEGKIAPLEDDGRRLVERVSKPEIRVSSRASKDRATSWISFGDAQFEEQKYHSAAQRYKAAAVAAPDVADAHFRTGYAYVASNRFDLAADAFRRGLAIDPLWVNSSFDINSLYGKNQLAKRSHVDTLARLALADKTNEDYLFLIGVYLHFDGQPERATKFFERAAAVADGETAYLDIFISGPDGPVEKAVSVPAADA